MDDDDDEGAGTAVKSPDTKDQERFCWWWLLLLLLLLMQLLKLLLIADELLLLFVWVAGLATPVTPTPPPPVGAATALESLAVAPQLIRVGAVNPPASAADDETDEEGANERKPFVGCCFIPGTRDKLNEYYWNSVETMSQLKVGNHSSQVVMMSSQKKL